MGVARVLEYVHEGRMEWLPGEQEIAGVRREVWIPVAQFVQAKRWRKKMSDAHGAGPMAVMQLAN